MFKSNLKSKKTEKNKFIKKRSGTTSFRSLITINQLIKYLMIIYIRMIIIILLTKILNFKKPKKKYIDYFFIIISGKIQSLDY